MRLLLITVAVSVLTYTNCQTSDDVKSESTLQENTAIQESWEEIMAVHDEIMPISMKLPPIWEEIDTILNDVNEAEAIELKALSEELKKVHKDMYDWMEDARLIKERITNASESELEAVVEKEISRIEKIKKETNEAFETANKRLNTEE